MSGTTDGPVAASGGPASTSHRRWWRRFAPLLVAAVLVLVSIAIRIAFRGVLTSDMDVHVLRWYAKFKQLGIGVGLGKDFYDYSPPYMYLVALATFTSPFLSALTSIKLIATAFDIYLAFVMFKIVRLRFPEGYLPYLAAGIWFSAPTILANAAVWGQADSVYMAFLLTCIYLILIDKPLPAMLFFSIGFAFKPQPFFLVPLLLLLVLWRRMPWYLFVLVPVIYALAVWPAVAFGRTWIEVIDLYLARPAAGKALTHNAATAYAFIPRSALGMLGGPGLAIAAIPVLAWILYTWRSTKRFDRSTLLLLAVISVTLTAFVLPNMHDRYFYPADTLSIALAFTLPELWFVPVLFQVISGLSYSIYLLSASADNVGVAAGLNLLVLTLLIIKQIQLNRKTSRAAEHEMASA